MSNLTRRSFIKNAYSGSLELTTAAVVKPTSGQSDQTTNKIFLPSVMKGTDSVLLPMQSNSLRSKSMHQSFRKKFLLQKLLPIVMAFSIVISAAIPAYAHLYPTVNKDVVLSSATSPSMPTSKPHSNKVYLPFYCR